MIASRQRAAKSQRISIGPLPELGSSAHTHPPGVIWPMLHLRVLYNAINSFLTSLEQYVAVQTSVGLGCINKCAKLHK